MWGADQVGFLLYTTRVTKIRTHVSCMSYYYLRSSRDCSFDMEKIIIIDYLNEFDHGIEDFALYIPGTWFFDDWLPASRVHVDRLAFLCLFHCMPAHFAFFSVLTNC